MRQVHIIFICSSFLIHSFSFCQNTNDSIMGYYQDLYESIQISQDGIVDKRLVKKKYANRNIKEIYIRVTMVPAFLNMSLKKGQYIEGSFGRDTKFYSNQEVKRIRDYDVKNSGNFPDKKYHKNGDLKREGEFINMKKAGLWRFYNKKGELIKEKNFKGKG